MTEVLPPVSDRGTSGDALPQHTCLTESRPCCREMTVRGTDGSGCTEAAPVHVGRDGLWDGVGGRAVLPRRAAWSISSDIPHPSLRMMDCICEWALG